MGPKTAEFEKRFSEQMNVTYALAVSNGTCALHLALKVLGIKEGDEVIVPSLTFVATVNAICYVGAKPVFCDVTSLEDLTINPEMIENLVTERTRAILVMHYAGFPCNMDRIMYLASKYNLKVVEDACHGLLSEYKGRKLGTIGHLGCFSFFSNKNIATGEGGMLVTKEEQYYTKAKLLRSHGMTTLSYERSKGHSTAYDVVDLGFNYRLDDIRSALGLVQLAKLEKDLQKRAALRQHYVKNLVAIEGIIIPFQRYEDFVSNYIFPIVLEKSTAEKRDKLRSHLQAAGIQTSVHYPAIHKFSVYSEPSVRLPLTEYVSDNEVTLPMYSALTTDEIEYIGETIKQAL